MSKPTTPLPRSTPEAQGVASSAITEFIDQVNKNIQHLHSFMLLRHGVVITEGWWHPYQSDLPHMLFSLSKSFTSTAVGMAISEGLLTVDDPVLMFFPEDAPRRISTNLASMTVQHLLSMSTGHSLDTTDRVLLSRNPFKTFLSIPIEHKPGTFFVYNTAASFMLAAIIQKLTGQTLIEYLTPRLFEPLGIEGATWDSHPNGINFGGFGLHLKTEDIARFGQLYLQRGCWNGQQLIPEAWVAEATVKHSDNSANQTADWQSGYGYQFWICQPPGVYRGDGAFGQFCVVMPEQKAVLAMTGGMAEMQPVLDLAWDCLLPAMKESTLPENFKANQSLVQAMKELSIQPPKGNTIPSSVENSISCKTWFFKPNPLKLETLHLDFASNTLIYHLLGSAPQGGSHALSFGRSEWAQGVSFLGIDLYRTPVSIKAVTSGAWKTASTFALTICLYETPYILTLSFSFLNEEVRVKYQANVSFGPLELPDITGVSDND